MFGFRGITAAASAIGLMTIQPSTSAVKVDPRELSVTEISFRSTFRGVDADGESLVWSADSPAGAPKFVLRVKPMGSALSSAESVWAVSATMTTSDSSGTSMESKMYGIIDWSKQEMRLHGDCETGTRAGSSVTATGAFTNLDVAGTVEVLPLTASR